MSCAHNANGIGKHILGIVVSVVALVALFSSTDIVELRRIIDCSAPWGPLVYIGIKALFYVAAPLSSLPLQIAAGATFGMWMGAIYTLIGSLIGGSVNFGLARMLGRPIIARMRGGSITTRLDVLGHRFASWPALMLARIFFSPLYDFISYAIGLTKMPFLQYVIVSFIGGIVPTFLWAAFGASLANGGLSIFVIAMGLLLFLLTTVFLRKGQNYRDL